MTGHFSQEALAQIDAIFAENQENKLLGECNQKAKREQSKQARTPAQTEADKTRAQANRGRDTVSSGVRSEAARRAAETRKRCKGGASTPQQPG